MKHRPQHHRHLDTPIMCSGKRRYPSKTQAELVKEQQETINDELELKVYRCQAGCGGWHLTRRNDEGRTA